MKKITFLALLTIWFCGCDPPLNQYQTLKNSSNDTLVISRNPKSVFDTMQILPHTERDVFEVSGLGGRPEISCIAMDSLQSLVITTKFKKKLLKNLLDDNNWISEYKKIGAGSFQRCTFEIFDKDLK